MDNLIATNSSEPEEISEPKLAVKDAGSHSDNSFRLRWGWLSFRPNILQGLLSPKWALFWLCWAGAVQGIIVNGLINVSISTIERRFGLQSSLMGWVSSGYDIASFFVLIPLTYFGGRASASKPRWIGWGVVLMGLGSLVFALPHFLVGRYWASRGGDVDVCLSGAAAGASQPLSATGNSTLSHPAGDESDSTVDYSWTILVFFAAQLLHGTGAAPLFTLGVTYIDENVSKKMSSVYLGIYYSVTVIGPACGYLVGGQLLQLYTDLLSVDPLDYKLTPQSKVWVGAWWIGFIFMAVFNMVIAVAIFGFPSSLPGSEELERVSEAHGGGGAGGGTEVKSFTDVKHLPQALWSMIRNVPLTFLNLAGASEGLVIAGFAAFLPKVVENQFGLTPIAAALLVGTITIPAGGGGTFLGGYLVKKWKLNCTGIIKLCLIVTVMAVLMTGALLLRCPDVSFAGITAPYERDSQTMVAYGNSNRNGSLESPCNQNCGGCKKFYDPVCGVDNVMYYNPCFAGCKEEQADGPSKTYLDCSCVTVNHSMGVLPHYDAINTMCDNTCSNMYWFSALCFLLMLFTFLATMPALAATLRCVHDDQKSFALGIQWLKVRILGTIPAPLIFGTLLDNSCLYKKGSCLVYNQDGMSKYMFYLAFISKLASALFFLGAWWSYTPPKSAQTSPITTSTAATTTTDARKVNEVISNGDCCPKVESSDKF